MNENSRTYRVAHLAARIARIDGGKTFNAHASVAWAIDLMRLEAKARDAIAKVAGWRDLDHMREDAAGV